MTETLEFPLPDRKLEFTGERYVSGIEGPIQHEHYHRYLYAAQYCVGKDVLDIACGEGYGSVVLRQVAREVIGVDADQTAIDFATRAYAREGLRYLQGDATRLPIASESVDVVVSFETIEHFTDHDAFLADVTRVLRPGGLLIISSPNTITYSEEPEYNNPFHLKELDREQFRDLLRSRFARVEILEQNASYGSYILRENGTPESVEVLRTTDGRSYKRSVGAPDATYFVAVCSSTSSPPIHNSILNNQSTHIEATRAADIARAEAAEAHAVALAHEVRVRETEIGRLNAVMEREGARLTALAARADARIVSFATALSSMFLAQRESERRLNEELARPRAEASTRGGTCSAARALSRLFAPTARSNPSVDGRPRVLFVDWATPRPDHDSGSLDIWHQMQIFVGLGFDVTFMPAGKFIPEGEYTTALERKEIRCINNQSAVSPEEFIEMEIRGYELAILCRHVVFARLHRVIKRASPLTKVLFVPVDLHFVREERAALLLKQGSAGFQADRTREQEVAAARDADATIVLSDVEETLLRRWVPTAQIATIPFPREVPGRSAPFDARDGVLFVGGFAHQPNVDAILWFVANVWPIVRERMPHARLTIVGSNPTDEVMRLANESTGIVVLGFVKDIAPLLTACRVTIAPLRYGAGIKGKVAMSLINGVPCVATSIATEGMQLEHGVEVLGADGPVDFATAIVLAHDDERTWLRLSDAGFAFGQDTYSIERVRARFADLLSRLGFTTLSGAGAKAAETAIASPIFAPNPVMAARRRRSASRSTADETSLKTKILLMRLVFHSSGRPRKLARKLLTRSNGKPRGLFRRLICKKNGTPRPEFKRLLP
jgi:ubiquinone/menaquinone biosynthesis C-methylase UbiE/glycosyltransferase involved in cell wall biosynthesis